MDGAVEKIDILQIWVLNLIPEIYCLNLSQISKWMKEEKEERGFARILVSVTMISSGTQPA